MTIINEDHRKLLIDIFFAVIITIGLEKFLHTFLLGHLQKLSSFDIPILLNTFSAPAILFNMFLFFAAYFWVISHWIFYHELIKKYPYYRCTKFLVDVAIFSIMFVIINISFSSYGNATFSLFILLIVIWYFFACLWHLSDRGLRPLRLYLVRHIERLATFIPLLVLSYDPFSISHTYGWYSYVIASSVIVAMIAWNVQRLKKYVHRDLREYDCDYLRGYPGCNSRISGGRISWEIDKKRKTDNNNNERGHIIFKGTNSNSSKICIRFDDILEADMKSGRPELNEDRVVMQITCKYENGDIVKPVFGLKYELIRGVLDGIDELISQDRKLISLSQIDR